MSVEGSATIEWRARLDGTNGLILLLEFMDDVSS